MKGLLGGLFFILKTFLFIFYLLRGLDTNSEPLAQLASKNSPKRLLASKKRPPQVH